MLPSKSRQEELPTAAVALHCHALVVVAVTVERRKALGDMREHQTQAKPLTELDPELES